MTTILIILTYRIIKNKIGEPSVLNGSPILYV